MKKPINAVIYLRTNGVKKDDLEIQEKKCREYAERNNINIKKTIETFENIGKENVDAVIIANYSRISRNAYEFSLRAFALKHIGIELIVADNKKERAV